MDWLYEILNNFFNCFLFDKEWWKDYGIPLLAIFVSIFLWFLSYISTVKKKDRKELVPKELAPNLNLLLSFCVDGIERLKSLREVFIKIHNIEKDAKGERIESFAYSKSASVLWQKYSFPMDLSIINVANYNLCIDYSSDFATKLSKIISAFKNIIFKIENRNSYVEKIINQHPLEKAAYLQSIINMDLQDHEDFIIRINAAILCIKDFIIQIESLKDKIKGLNIAHVTFTNEFLDFFSQLEKEMEKKNDK